MRAPIRVEDFLDDGQRESDQLAKEKFLLEEGLDLLSNYRSISDVAVRAVIRELVGKIAAKYLI